MWKLILFISVLTVFVSSQERRRVIVVIINDCEEWRLLDSKPGTNHIRYLRKGIELPVSFSHAWMIEQDKLSTKRLTYSEILKSDYIFSSQLNLEEWYELENDHSRRIFILRPEDYCSGKRFWYNYQFVLYEVKLFVEATGNDVAPLEIPIAPIPAVDTLRRKKNN